jgi:hypothetical protein
VHRFVVVCSLRPLHTGERFATAAWPLHMTIVPTFFTPSSDSDVAAALAPVATRLSPLSTTGIGLERFGAKATVDVTELARTPALAAAHDALVDALEPLGLEFETPDHTRAGYRPHVSAKRYGRIEVGQTVRLDEIALVDMRPGQPEGMRAVLAVAPLGG